MIRKFTQQNSYFPLFRLSRLTVICAFFALLGMPPAAAQGQAGPYGAASPFSTGPSSLSIGGTQNSFTGSVPSGKATSEVLPLSFEEAIKRGLQQNLGLLLASDSTISSRGQRWKELSNLLPNVNGTLAENVQTASIAQFGFKLPGLPRVIGPFNYSDIRGSVSQSLFNFNYIEKERAASANLQSSQFNYKDARELVVLAVGNSYLQALAGTARVATAEAQVTTAQALYNKAADQQRAGVSPAIDVLRAQVELQTRQQQLIVTRNDFAKQKLALARIIGLPPGQEFTLADKAPYAPLTTEGLQQNLQRAYTSRFDYQAALSQVRAAELSRRAATAEYFPSLDIEANYGDIGVSPFRSNGTYHVGGTVNIPIFQGGRVHGDTLQAEASLRQARHQIENLRGQIDFEVRTAMLDLNAAADQVQVAESSVNLAQQTLTQAQDRFSAGVTDNLEVIQAQEALASANENYIASLYAHNLAKVEFAKAIGYAEQGVKNYLKGK